MEKFIGTYNRIPEWTCGSGITASTKGCHVVAQLQGAHSGCIRKQCDVTLELVALCLGAQLKSWGLGLSPLLSPVFLGFASLSGRPSLSGPRGSSRFLFYHLYNLRTKSFSFSVDTTKVPQMSLIDLAWVRCSSLTTGHLREYLLICLPIIHSLFSQ